MEESRQRPFRVDVFVRELKDATLLHHHTAIDAAVLEYLSTRAHARFARRLVEEVGSKETVLRCARAAHVAYAEEGERQSARPTRTLERRRRTWRRTTRS